MTLVQSKDPTGSTAVEDLVTVTRRVSFGGYLVAQAGDRVSRADAERWGALEDAEEVEVDPNTEPARVPVDRRVVFGGYLVAVPGDLVDPADAERWGITGSAEETEAPAAKKGKTAAAAEPVAETASESAGENAAETPPAV